MFADVGRQSNQNLDRLGCIWTEGNEFKVGETDIDYREVSIRVWELSISDEEIDIAVDEIDHSCEETKILDEESDALCQGAYVSAQETNICKREIRILITKLRLFVHDSQNKEGLFGYVTNYEEKN